MCKWLVEVAYPLDQSPRCFPPPGHQAGQAGPIQSHWRTHDVHVLSPPSATQSGIKVLANTWISVIHQASLSHALPLPRPLHTVSGFLPPRGARATACCGLLVARLVQW